MNSKLDFKPQLFTTLRNYNKKTLMADVMAASSWASWHCHLPSPSVSHPE